MIRQLHILKPLHAEAEVMCCVTLPGYTDGAVLRRYGSHTQPWRMFSPAVLQHITFYLLRELIQAVFQQPVPAAPHQAHILPEISLTSLSAAQGTPTHHSPN